MESEITQKEIGQYLDGLSPIILSLVLDKTWKGRVKEVAQKYSLSEEQSTTLHNLVLFVLIQVEEPVNLQASIQEELGISDLLTEQIMTDLDARVFQYFVDFAESKIKTETKSTQVPNTPASAKMEIKNEPAPIKVEEKKIEEAIPQKEIPEVRPEITPMVESPAEREVVQKTWSNVDTKPAPSPVAPKAPAPSYAPNNLPGVEIPSEKPKSIIDSKLSSPVNANAPIPKPNEEKPIVKQYAVDPYREPLE